MTYTVLDFTVYVFVTAPFMSFKHVDIKQQIIFSI